MQEKASKSVKEEMGVHEKKKPFAFPADGFPQAAGRVPGFRAAFPSLRESINLYHSQHSQ